MLGLRDKRSLSINIASISFYRLDQCRDVLSRCVKENKKIANMCDASGEEESHAFLMRSFMLFLPLYCRCTSIVARRTHTTAVRQTSKLEKYTARQRRGRGASATRCARIDSVLRDLRLAILTGSGEMNPIGRYI